MREPVAFGSNAKLPSGAVVSEPAGSHAPPGTVGCCCTASAAPPIGTPSSRSSLPRTTTLRPYRARYGFSPRSSITCACGGPSAGSPTTTCRSATTVAFPAASRTVTFSVCVPSGTTFGSTTRSSVAELGHGTSDS